MMPLPTPSAVSDADGSTLTSAPRKPILLCLSHLRWNFVLQRPQHLMQRFAARYDVLYVEEPIERDGPPSVTVADDGGVTVVTPHLPAGFAGDRDAALATLIDTVIADRGALVAVRWFYTPMMLPIARHIASAVTVYDCVDELSAFRFAPAELPALEGELLAIADVVFTGGYSLYEAKRDRHANIHPFPSSVDGAHFARARAVTRADDTPTFGFYGVIDERLDLGLLATVADARPGYRFEIVGPVKIDPATLPRRGNIHYPGGQDYAALPDWLGRWDVALMPFAINASTRFISPIKTPEYLAGGRPVVSTAITDVVRHYGNLEGVRIADDAAGFVAACDALLALARSGTAWRSDIDAALAARSWDVTQAAMQAEIDAVVADAAAIRPRRWCRRFPADRAGAAAVVCPAGFEPTAPRLGI